MAALKHFSACCMSFICGHQAKLCQKLIFRSALLHQYSLFAYCHCLSLPSHSSVIHWGRRHKKCCLTSDHHVTIVNDFAVVIAADVTLLLPWSRARTCALDRLSKRLWWPQVRHIAITMVTCSNMRTRSSQQAPVMASGTVRKIHHLWIQLLSLPVGVSSLRKYYCGTDCL